MQFKYAAAQHNSTVKHFTLPVIHTQTSKRCALQKAISCMFSGEMRLSIIPGKGRKAE